MKEPNPPFLEFGFYFANLPEADAFSALVKALLDMGAQFSGVGAVHQGLAIRNKPFASIRDEVLDAVTLKTIANLTQWLTAPDARLIQVYMQDASGIVGDIAEVVTYLSISREAARIDRHPLAIWTEGDLFCGTHRLEFANCANEAGTQAYKRLCALAEALGPAYAAITLEYALECPMDLRRDPRSLAFRDFFVSGRYLGSAKLEIIRRLFAGAYIEPIADGLYVSCTEEFNPTGSGLDADYVQWQSVEVGKLIASV